LDVCVLSELGQVVQKIPAPPDADGLRYPARKRFGRVYRGSGLLVTDYATGGPAVALSSEKELRAMPLHPRVLNSVVRITSAGDFQGSGSIVYVPSETVDGHMWPYLVTAHHVVRSHESMIEVDVPDPEILGEIAEGIPVTGWVQPVPQVDLAIAPFPVDRAPRYQGFMLDHFMPRGSGIGLGGEILYVGIFAPENVPMARSGSIGAVNVPITAKDQFGNVYRYEADLVDCRSYKGFSGSPCLSLISYAAHDTAPRLTPALAPRHEDGSPMQLRNLVTTSAFCGIITRHYCDETVPEADGAASRFRVCVMLSSDYVRLGFMAPSVVAERRKWDEELLRTSSES
jgi:hypothetical protein